jgi:hypothetical protein
MADMGNHIGDELALASGAGRALLAKLNGLDAVDRAWAERKGSAIVERTAARLLRQLPGDVDPDAVPAALAYALAVVLAASEGLGVDAAGHDERVDA